MSPLSGWQNFVLQFFGSHKTKKSIMRKRDVLKWIMLLQLAVLALAGCSEPIQEIPISSTDVWEAGGVVEGFNGEVVLTVPPGALKDTVKFRILELSNNSTSSECELLRAFVIEPSVTFKVPARLQVYSNGCLSNGKTICEGMEVYFNIWGSLTDYCNQSGQCCTNCCFEAWSQSVSSCISRTGVFQTMGRKP